MKKNPEVSIVIPVYNVEKFLPQALDSLLLQTFPDFEAVCVNDGSSDGCGRILNDYARKDSRFKVINQKNQGVSAARNAALDAARGNYIAFLDPDDWIHVRFLEIMLKKIKREKADIVWCDTVRITDREPYKTVALSDQPESFNIADPLERFILQKTPYPKGALWDKLFKAELFDNLRFETGIHVAEDFILMFSVLRKVRKAVYINAALKYYRVHEGSLMCAGLTDRYIDDHIAAYLLLKTRSADFSLPEKTEKVLARRLVKMLYRACVCSPYKKAPDRLVFRFWEKYSAVLAQMEQKGEFNPALLDFRKRFLTRLFLRGKFKLLRFFLKIRRLK